MNLNDALNACLKECTHTSGGAERRSKWIEENCPDEASTIVEQTDKILRACYELLVREDGVVWNKEFEDKLFKSLQEQFSWLSAEGYSSLSTWAHYNSMHDGLNRKLSFGRRLLRWLSS